MVIVFFSMEVYSKNKKALPHWLFWDDAASSFLGVPSKKDVGQHHVTVTAYGKHGDVAKDSFTIRVEPEKFDEFEHKDGKVLIFLSFFPRHRDQQSLVHSY